MLCKSNVRALPKLLKHKTMNTKKVNINVPSEAILKRLHSTPTFSRLSKHQLKIGDNVEVVNHKQFADMLRLYPLINVGINEIK
jgi:hypothetical protein